MPGPNGVFEGWSRMASIRITSFALTGITVLPGSAEDVLRTRFGNRRRERSISDATAVDLLKLVFREPELSRDDPGDVSTDAKESRVGSGLKLFAVVGAAVLTSLVGCGCSGNGSQVPFPDGVVVSTVDAHDALTDELLRTSTWARQAELASRFVDGQGGLREVEHEVHMMRRSLAEAQRMAASLEDFPVPGDPRLLAPHSREMLRFLDRADGRAGNAEGLASAPRIDRPALEREARAAGVAVHMAAVEHSTFLSLIPDERFVFLDFSRVAPRYGAALGYRLASAGLDRMLGYRGPDWRTVRRREAQLALERVQLIEGAIGTVSAGRNNDPDGLVDRLAAGNARLISDLSELAREAFEPGEEEERAVAEDARQELQQAENTYRRILKQVLSLRYPEFPLDDE